MVCCDFFILNNILIRNVTFKLNTNALPLSFINRIGDLSASMIYNCFCSNIKDDILNM